MEFKKLMTAAAIFGALVFGSSVASADTGAAAAFDAHFVTNSTCITCHSDGQGDVMLAFGNAWKAAGGDKNRGPSSADGWTQLDATYSDTYGGVEPDWVAPVASSSSGGCIASSVTTPLTMVLAMLTLGFFVRRKKD